MCFIYSEFCASKITPIWENKRKLYCVSHLLSRQHESIVALIFETGILHESVHNVSNHSNNFQNHTFFLTLHLRKFILKYILKKQDFSPKCCKRFI